MPRKRIKRTKVVKGKHGNLEESNSPEIDRPQTSTLRGRINPLVFPFDSESEEENEPEQDTRPESDPEQESEPGRVPEQKNESSKRKRKQKNPRKKDYPSEPGPSSIPEYLPRIVSASTSNQIQHRRKRRIDKALRDIKKIQETYHTLSPKGAFLRSVQQTVRELGVQDFRFETISLEALQDAAEAYMISLLEDAYLYAIDGIVFTNSN